MEIIPQHDQFDRDYDIHDLLHGLDLNQLQGALRKLFSLPYRMVDLSGKVIIVNGQVGEDCQRTALSVELEPVAYLEGGDPDLLEAAALLVTQLLKCSSRFHMVSSLHLEAVHADYEKLQQRNKLLQESEQRYKVLAENLEQRVEEQVKTIEHTQLQLFQAEKMASVGHLAAGVAHEINNPIGFIRSNLVTASGYLKDLSSLIDVLSQDGEATDVKANEQEDVNFIIDDFSQLIDESVDGADRIAKIVASLKEFSNVDGADRSEADINALIKSVVNLASAQINEHMELELELNALPLFNCRPDHLSQVFLNILLNAVDAVGENQGKIIVASRYIDSEIVITVSDNGKGIPEEVIGNIFNPFFTTHDVGQGTGLGMTVAQDVVRAHGGYIEVDSVVGTGTTIGVHLPVTE